MTDKDAEQETRKLDEIKRTQWQEQVNYQLFSDDIVNGKHDLNMGPDD